MLKNLFRSNASIIEEIHNEFNTASDKALAAAKKILDKPMPSSKNKADRLAKLGFVNTKEVAEINKTADEKARFRKLADTIMYYATNYPQYKYITKEDVETICKKYNLVRGHISRYIGFVPEKNMSEMESFTINEKDKATRTAMFHTRDNKKTTQFSFEEEQSVRRGNYITYDYTYDTVAEDFEICAPQKEMKVSGNEYVDSKTRKIMQHIPDPIILQPVSRGGFLIVTAWGEEASDPLIAND